MSRLPLIALALIALAGCRAAPEAANNAQASTTQANTDHNMTVGKAKLQVEIALTPKQQEQGLMFRKDMPAGHGMLFPFMPPKSASFWMKNTVIPLDMIFIAPDGTVEEVFASREPYSLEPTSTGSPNIAVLELAGGEAARLGIVKGDKAQWGDCPYPAGAGPSPGSFLSLRAREYLAPASPTG